MNSDYPRNQTIQLSVIAEGLSDSKIQAGKKNCNYVSIVKKNMNVFAKGFSEQPRAQHHMPRTKQYHVPARPVSHWSASNSDICSTYFSTTPVKKYSDKVPRVQTSRQRGILKFKGTKELYPKSNSDTSEIQLEDDKIVPLRRVAFAERVNLLLLFGPKKRISTSLRLPKGDNRLHAHRIWRSKDWISIKRH